MTRAQEFEMFVHSFHRLAQEDKPDEGVVQAVGQALMGFVLVHWEFLRDAIKSKEEHEQQERVRAFMERVRDE